ncbi:hypothetical protein H8N03_22545 [Ramlibacter sp. USB13]|uniref:Uncharacterized protein n=1 Tax=Ramlibacter cellulosilyticus TaxID=2764187 RepID=A0A923MUY1_9BURK|nr:hypothetical protein [Ramlibacter cellulosilyticus]MBC5785738.1 hypothetical protein [Ramlibacter cellulosilyticus]
MDETQARQMRDQHSRDEAQLRRSQQVAAGDRFAPVESSPQHGAAPLGGGGNEAAVVEDYERALSAERSAWERFRSLPHRSDAATEWQEWRSAVEARDGATRVLINHFLEERAGTPLQAGGVSAR